MVEDLDNYHLKELRCSTQCHTQKTMWITARGDECLILWEEYWVLRYLLGAQILYTWSLQIANIKGGKDSQRELTTSSGKKCEKNYSSVRRYVADPVNVSPNGQPLSLLSKEQDLKWFATNSAVHLIILSLKESFETAQEMITQVYGLLSSCLVQYFSFKENEVFQDMQLIQKLRGDQKCMKKVVPSSRSKATKDIISIGSFVEVLVLNHYVFVRKIFISPTRYYKDDSCWSADLKSKATKDIINIGSFMEVLVLNHYASTNLLKSQLSQHGRNDGIEMHAQQVLVRVDTKVIAVDGWMGWNADIKDDVSVKLCHKLNKLQLLTAEFCPIEEIQRMEHELWNLKVKEYDIVAYTQRFNELALMCLRMIEPERVKVDAYIRGLTDNIKGEATSSKPADLNEVVRMAHKLMDNSRQTLQNNQKQGNARAMVTAPTDGKLHLCEHCFTRHVGQCTIKCHKCGKVGHKSRY
ncbi:hypothetical protein Tco_0742383, partial [Tanacetum coccineum]